MVEGILVLVLASVAYGLGPVFMKTSLESGLSAQWCTTYRWLLAIPISLLLIKANHYSLKITKKQFFHLLIFGTAGMGMTIFLLTCSYQYLPTGVATLIHFSYPVFVNVIMIAIYKEKCTVIKVASIVLALAGIVEMTNFNGDFSIVGMGLALISGVTYGIYLVANKKSAMSQIHPFVTSFYISLFSFFVFLIHSLKSENIQIPTHFKTWLGLFMASSISTIFALYMTIKGIKKLGASKASIIGVIEPLTSVICGTIFFDEEITISFFLGGILILGSLVLVVMEAKKENQYNSIERNTGGSVS